MKPAPPVYCITRERGRAFLKRLARVCIGKLASWIRYSHGER